MRRLKLCLAVAAVLEAGSPAIAENVVAVITGDWNRDNVRDAAMILQPEGSEDDNRLKIYLANPVGGHLILKVMRPEFVWGNNAMAGQVPSLEPLANGSFAVTSQNDGIGRNRWKQKLTIAYRDGAFGVAGFTYSARDTLELNKVEECDLNLRAGVGTINGIRKKFQPVRKSVIEWDENIALEICGP